MPQVEVHWWHHGCEAVRPITMNAKTQVWIRPATASALLDNYINESVNLFLTPFLTEAVFYNLDVLFSTFLLQ